MSGDRFCWTFPERRSFSGRPRNVLRPLVVQLVVRGRTGKRPPNPDGGDQLQVRLYRSDSGREGQTTLAVAVRRAGRQWQLFVHLRYWTDVRGLMRKCLAGTGYRMDTRWERELARWAHRRGIRRDAVSLPG